MKPAPSILLVDDDRHLADSMADWLLETGYVVSSVGSINEAKTALGQKQYDLLLSDLNLGPDDGLELIKFCAAKYPETAILVMTGYAGPETAVEVVRCGAFDLLTKPLIDDELSLSIQRAIQQRHVTIENEQLRRQLDQRSGMENILSHDYRMLKIFDTVDSVADAKASILITGENGTGKSMIARAIHARGSRRGGPFVEVACGALPDTLLESELFGHVAGAYTGANTEKDGKFQLADGGTLFLDEIGTATPAMQVKLLRVLQEYQFERLGGTRTHSVDTRVILATNENLSLSVQKGTFRQDLYYRINVINIELPSLRERLGDLPLLVDHFLREAAEACGRPMDAFDTAAIQCMQAYHWPGNIRQLENVVERAVLLGRGPVLTIDDLPPELTGADGGPLDYGATGQNLTSGSALTGVSDARGASGAGPESVRVGEVSGKSLREALEGPERQIILRSLKAHRWNRAATADALDINRTTLYKKMKRLGLDDPRLQYA